MLTNDGTTRSVTSKVARRHALRRSFIGMALMLATLVVSGHASALELRHEWTSAGVDVESVMAELTPDGGVRAVTSSRFMEFLGNATPTNVHRVEWTPRSLNNSWEQVELYPTPGSLSGSRYAVVSFEPRSRYPLGSALLYDWQAHEARLVGLPGDGWVAESVFLTDADVLVVRMEGHPVVTRGYLVGVRGSDGGVLWNVSFLQYGDMESPKLMARDGSTAVFMNRRLGEYWILGEAGIVRKVTLIGEPRSLAWSSQAGKFAALEQDRWTTRLVIYDPELVVGSQTILSDSYHGRVGFVNSGRHLVVVGASVDVYELRGNVPIWWSASSQVNATDLIVPGTSSGNVMFFAYEEPGRVMMNWWDVLNQTLKGRIDVPSWLDGQDFDADRGVVLRRGFQRIEKISVSGMAAELPEVDGRARCSWLDLIDLPPDVGFDGIEVPYLAEFESFNWQVSVDRLGMRTAGTHVSPIGDGTLALVKPAMIENRGPVRLGSPVPPQDNETIRIGLSFNGQDYWEVSCIVYWNLRPIAEEAPSLSAALALVAVIGAGVMGRRKH